MNDLSLYEKVAPLERNFPVKFRIASKASAYRLHWHEHLELLYFRSDHCKVLCNGKTYIANKDDLIIVNCNELHATYGGDFFCMRINPSFFADVDFDNIVFPPFIRKDEILKDCLERIYDEQKNMLAGYDMEIKSITYHMICYLLRNYKSDILSKSDALSKKQNACKVGEILTYIACNCHNKVTTSTVAESFHLSEPYLCHLFKSQTSMSPMAYINQFRIDKAQTLLKHTDQSITDIALSVGFDDSNYFARVFKKQTGVSPREYKEKHKMI